MSDKKIIEFIGRVERINYPKNRCFISNGEYGIVKMRCIENISNAETKKLYSLKGNCCEMEENGFEIKIKAEYESTHEIYGDSYKILFSQKIVDLSDKNKQKRFLKTIISENLVDNLYKGLKNPMQIIENNDIETLKSIKGIGELTAKRIIEKYNETKDNSEIYAELYNTGITPKMINKVIKHFKSPDITLSKIKENPYSLIEVDGIGFIKADEIAIKAGLKRNDKRRIIACVYNILNENGEDGKSYMYYDDLKSSVLSIIKEEFNYDDIISQMKHLKFLDNNRIALEKYYNLELAISEELKRLMNSTSYLNITEKQIENRIKETEQEQGFNFDKTQLKGIKESAYNNVVAVTGGAGTGKTSTAKGICNLFPQAEVKATALSGRASLRITEATGYFAQTIHKLIGINENGSVTHNRDNPIKADILLIDEATMINGSLMLKLLKSVPKGCKVIFMGDIQQLPPIGNCQVFEDILNSNYIPTIKLLHPHRQALQSGIIKSSYLVANQEQLFDKTYSGDFIYGDLNDMEFHIKSYQNKEHEPIMQDLINAYKKELTKFKSLTETHIITPVKSRGYISCENINKIIQKAFNRDTNKMLKNASYEFYIGDKVINTKNDYTTMNVIGENSPIFNGSIGIIKDIEDDKMLVQFTDGEKIWLNNENIKNIELGYATTVHKTQGSEFKSVIVVMDNNSYIMQNCELLYTAITRAKEYCIVISPNICIHNSIKKKETKCKQTFLKEFLKE